MAEDSRDWSSRPSKPNEPTAAAQSYASPIVFWSNRATLNVQHGPLNLRIQARTGGTVDRAAAHEAARAALEALDELAPHRPMLATPAWLLPSVPGWPLVLRYMVAAVKATGDRTLTPLAAVAGSIAQVALEVGVRAGVGTMVVDNGGDIALAVAPGERIRVGVAESLGQRSATHVITVESSAEIGGICTSGLGGRSFTRGVAQAAVAASRTASVADACATVLGNATYVAHPSIEQRRAGDLDHATDIADLYVTTRVGRLPDVVVCRSLAQAERTAHALLERGLLLGGLVQVQGEAIVIPLSFAVPTEPSHCSSPRAGGSAPFP